MEHEGPTNAVTVYKATERQNALTILLLLLLLLLLLNVKGKVVLVLN
jgi:hypothetical protein